MIRADRKTLSFGADVVEVAERAAQDFIPAYRDDKVKVIGDWCKVLRSGVLPAIARLGLCCCAAIGDIAKSFSQYDQFAICALTSVRCRVSISAVN